ncbi:MAG: hypothetical protein A3K77_03465 [Euryarchaeota archaeon RBG_13_31_8]|nr:MAG: hypothetical protein A3K77_03465 [Euryarchaeota archaeon RBG_13_31_8]
MDLTSLYSSDIFKWVILPILIFFLRLTDVSLATLRIMFISRGLKYLAPIIAFFEINIWLLAIGQIIMNLGNIVCTLAYAAGFALGNLLGIMIEEKLSIGLVLVRIITKHDAEKLVDCLKEEKYGVTIHDAEGLNGKVKIIFAVIRRKDLSETLNRVEKVHPHAFYTVEDVRSVGEAVFPIAKNRGFGFLRKGK